MALEGSYLVRVELELFERGHAKDLICTSTSNVSTTRRVQPQTQPQHYSELDLETYCQHHISFIAEHSTGSGIGETRACIADQLTWDVEKLIEGHVQPRDCPAHPRQYNTTVPANPRKLLLGHRRLTRVQVDDLSRQRLQVVVLQPGSTYNASVPGFS
eukprot:2337151-Rhodomonas_salina.3